MNGVKQTTTEIITIEEAIHDYKQSRTDTKSNKKQLREYLSEYLEIPADNISILLDEIIIVLDYFTDKQVRRILKVFEKIYKIEPHYGDQVRVTIYLTENEPKPEEEKKYPKIDSDIMGSIRTYV